MTAFSAIPPVVMLELGKAFGAPLAEGMGASEHYDQAMFHLLSYAAGDNIDPTLGVSHLALAMKHTALLMSGTMPKINPTMALALGQGAMFNQTSQLQTPPPAETPPPAAEPEQPPAPQTQEPEQPKPQVRMTGDGWVIHDYVPGVTLSTEQARERAGVSKSMFAKLLQQQEFVRPMGVVIMASGQKAKVYAAEDVDTWVAMRGTKKSSKQSEAARDPATVEKRMAAKAYNDALPIVDWSAVRYGEYLTTDQVAEVLQVSRSHIYNLQKKDEFPKASHRAKDPSQGGGMLSVLYRTDDLNHWIATSRHPLAFRTYKRREAQDAAGRASVDGAQSEPDPVDVGTLSNVEGWVKEAEVEAEAEPAKKVAQPAKQWLNLRDVAEYLGMTETTVEQMVKTGRFPKAHKQDSRLHIRQWGNRQVAKWKRDNIENGALAK